MAPPVPSARELARFTLAVQHPTTREWEDDEARLGRLATAHEFDVRLATDHELAAARADRMQVDQMPEAFLNRWTRVSPDLEAMLSIRFEGGDVSKPFVDATVLSRRFAVDDLPTLARVATGTYGRFRPGYLRLWSAEATDAVPGTGRDKRFLAAPVADLAGRSGTPSSLTLAVTHDLSRYADASAAYAAVDAEHPGHPEQAALQAREDLTECAEAGTLFDVLVAGEWAGYVGALEDSALGLDAYVVQEVILRPEYRGRRYGSHLTTLLARALPDQARILLGTIHADNRGAITAAVSAGRQDVGGWLQVPLHGADVA